MPLRLSARLPAGEHDGTEPLCTAMVTNPEAPHAVVMLVDCAKITTDTGSGDVIPTARILAIEGFAIDTAEARQVTSILRHAYEDRTGKVALFTDDTAP